MSFQPVIFVVKIIMKRVVLLQRDLYKLIRAFVKSQIMLILINIIIHTNSRIYIHPGTLRFLQIESLLHL